MKKLITILGLLVATTSFADNLSALMTERLADSNCIQKELSKVKNSQRHRELLANGQSVNRVSFNRSHYVKYEDGSEGYEMGLVAIYTDGSTLTGSCKTNP